MKESIKGSVVKSITQILLIVFSVVLGLYLSERIEDRKNEKEATKLLSKIKAELNTNKSILDNWVPYHREIVKKLDSLTTDEKFIEDFISDKTTLYKVFSRHTLMGESPTNDTWDIAKSHPLIVNFEYDELFALSRIYNQQESTFESIPKLIELLLSTDLNAQQSAKSNLILFKDMLDDISMRELQLISYYNEAEEILKYRID